MATEMAGPTQTDVCCARRHCEDDLDQLECRVRDLFELLRERGTDWDGIQRVHEAVEQIGEILDELPIVGDPWK